MSRDDEIGERGGEIGPLTEASRGSLEDGLGGMFEAVERTLVERGEKRRCIPNRGLLFESRRGFVDDVFVDEEVTIREAPSRTKFMSAFETSCIRSLGLNSA